MVLQARLAAGGHFVGLLGSKRFLQSVVYFNHPLTPFENTQPFFLSKSYLKCTKQCILNVTVFIDLGQNKNKNK